MVINIITVNVTSMQLFKVNIYIQNGHAVTEGKRIREAKGLKLKA